MDFLPTKLVVFLLISVTLPLNYVNEPKCVHGNPNPWPSAPKKRSSAPPQKTSAGTPCGISADVGEGI